MTASRRLRRDGLLWQEVAGQVVVLDAERSSYLAINAAGTLLWRAIADGCTTDDLVEVLVGRYGIDPEQAVADVGRFVDELTRRGLLDTSGV